MHALPFIAAGAQAFSGVAGLAAGEENRRTAYVAADEELRASAAQARRIRSDARRAIGAQAAGLASSGMEGASSGGTALDALRESQVEAALDVMELRRQGAMKARALQRQGDNARREGAFGLVESLVGARTSYLTMKNDWAQARRDGT